jgi:quercetin dioxygenase-like cupin family protein
MQTTHAQSSSPSPRIPSREVIALEPGDGEPIWFLDNFLTIKTSAKDGSPYGLMEAVLPAGSTTPYHRHHADDEAFYVLDGEITFFVEGANGDVRRLRARRGSYVHVPRGIAHGFRTDSAIRMLVLSGVEGFIDMVREAGDVAPARELPPATAPDFERLGRAAARSRIDLLGPLPETDR